MQTRRQSRLEVAVDWLCMLGVNIGGQMVAYGMLATTWRAGDLCRSHHYPGGPETLYNTACL